MLSRDFIACAIHLNPVKILKQVGYADHLMQLYYNHTVCNKTLIDNPNPSLKDQILLLPV